MASPLAGIRVLDLSRVLAGPWATQTLADMGADVIKIERPGVGDETRSYAPFTPSINGAPGISTYFLAMNRGKRSITIDITQENGQELVRELADRSDVLVENYKVGSLAKLGLDYETLASRNPKLIYCSITGFGQTGPNRDRAAYDLVIQAMGGLMSLTGVPEGEPMKAGVAVADIATALNATTAILGALFEREHSGLGQYIDLALLDVQIAALLNQASSYLMTARVPQRQGNAHVSIVPYQAFASSDGQMIIAVANDLQFARLAKVLELTELIKDSRFRTNAARVRNRAVLIPMIEAALANKTNKEWLSLFDAALVPAGPINSIEEVFRDPQVAARELLLEFKSHTEAAIRVVGSPIKYSRTPIEYSKAPPLLGADTDQLLTDVLGKSSDCIQHLRHTGVI
jgi:crotonobetainyl-CoA:carnitine CoA-transferase CaiB-like acyl-CoA transferase